MSQAEGAQALDSHLTRRDGELTCEGVALATIAEHCGTPTYVYSKAALSDHLQAYQQALNGCDHLICYAVKANSNLAVLNLLAELGAGFDIVSVGELERVLRAGGDPRKTVFSGVGKTRQEMARALRANILCFNVESHAELEQLNSVAGELGCRAAVSLRVNPDVDAGTHPYIATGLADNKFGIPIAEALQAYQRAQTLPHIEITGVDCHIGSQLTELTPFAAALERVLLLLDTLKDAGITLQHIDLGGGLGVRYQDEQPPTPAQYISALRTHTDALGVTLILEPGRSIAANAGVLLTQVEYLKQNYAKHFAIVDAAMNDMIRPALYQAWMEIEPLSSSTTSSTTKTTTYDVVGPVCETGDFLGKDRELAIAAGDLLCIHSAGAYGFTMSSNYNSRPRAAEVMVDGDQFYVVRERESIDDLMRGEHLLADSQAVATSNLDGSN
ncbi:MAG: diaminopimelate decarboxylase [Porticoccaceae bacterium]|nr:diaminopimelate decarboxylase [Porticoccaceae bacterium]